MANLQMCEGITVAQNIGQIYATNGVITFPRIFVFQQDNHSAQLLTFSQTQSVTACPACSPDLSVIKHVSVHCVDDIQKAMTKVF